MDSLSADVIGDVALVLAVSSFGVLAIILLVALGDGARQYLAEEFASLGSNVIQILPGKRETQGLGAPVLGAAHRLTREEVLQRVCHLQDDVLYPADA